MAATKQAELDAATNSGGGAAEENPEEIDLDEEFDLDDEADGGGVENVQQKAVPASVFGDSLAKSREEVLAKEAEDRANGVGQEEEVSGWGPDGVRSTMARTRVRSTMARTPLVVNYAVSLAHQLPAFTNARTNTPYRWSHQLPFLFSTATRARWARSSA